MAIEQTDEYADWFDGLTDTQIRARINARIRRPSLGNPGDVKPVGGGVSEMRIDHGPGYRVYYKQQGKNLAVLLFGGTKKKQDSDIERALELAANL
ncbi:type II toxin-antitoxin system RelE/ParE family toxin [Candidatus Poriferisodalis sp.]|uniref:type II toxin-antitoxin system RelE/ParE family toxin n=1 Tax=Candidatus Poriferisodalis sp. TaxID=3101277 RepID=UPI003B02C247